MNAFMRRMCIVMITALVLGGTSCQSSSSIEGKFDRAANPVELSAVAQIAEWRDMPYPRLEGTSVTFGDPRVTHARLYHTANRMGWVDEASIDPALFDQTLSGTDDWGWVIDDRENSRGMIDRDLRINSAVLFSYPPFGPIMTILLKRVPTEQGTVVLEGHRDRLGRLMLQRRYRDGKLDGFEIHLYEHGGIHVIRQYRKGKHDGLMQQYTSDGRLILVQRFAAGKILESLEIVGDEWRQTVSEGTGPYSYFDDMGRVIGAAKYYQGKFVDGWH